MPGIFPSSEGSLTGAEIKSLYEAESDTNAFTDAQVSKLGTTQTVLSATLPTDATAVNGTSLTLVMTGPSLEANKRYSMLAMIHYTSGSSSDGNIAFASPTGSTGAWHQDLDGDQVPKLPHLVDGSGNPQTITVNGAGGSNPQVAYFIGVVFTSSTAGTLDLYVAENINGSTDFVMKAGTYIVCTELKSAV